MLNGLLKRLGFKSSAERHQKFVETLMNRVQPTPEQLSRRVELRIWSMNDAAEEMLRQAAGRWSDHQLEELSRRIDEARQQPESAVAEDEAWSWYVSTLDVGVRDLRDWIEPVLTNLSSDLGPEGLAERERLLDNAGIAFKKAMYLFGEDLVRQPR